MDSQNTEMLHSHNIGYLDANAVKLRLETAELIEAVKAFLKGSISVTKQIGDTIQILEVKTNDKPKCNAIGAAHIVNYVSSIINPSVVQGNYTDDWYRQCIENTHKRLAFMLVVNRHDWQITRDSMHSVIGFVMELVKPYLSRLIDNKERESYAATIKSTDSSTVRTKTPGVVGHFR